MTRVRATALLAAIGGLMPAISPAQPVASREIALDVASDVRRRGLGWSDGRAAATLSAYVPLTGPFALDAAATSLRGSARHGGADAVVDLGARATHDAGAWRLFAGATHHLFAGGRGRLDYAELLAGGGVLIGPATLNLAAAWAPSQRAIGGEILYLSSDARVDVPGTPWSVGAALGRTIGSGSSERARRLRPEGDCWDYRLAVDYRRGSWSTGVALTGTSSGTAAPGRFVDQHSGTRLAIRGGVRF